MPIPTSIDVPIIEKSGESWIHLDHLSSRYVVTAKQINKGKRQILDWDGHHCDQAELEDNIYVKPREWII